MATPEDDTLSLPESEIKYIQQVVGYFLYYARAIDNTIMTAVNEISITQSKPTLATKAKTTMLLDYLSTHPKVKIRYLARNM